MGHPVRYFKSDTAVQLGDHVQARIGCPRGNPRSGRIVYVTGISRPYERMQLDNFSWAGVQFPDDRIIAASVDPKTCDLEKGIIFEMRDSAGYREIQPDDPLPVRYCQSGAEVRLGDHVETSVLFRKKRGRIIYVPGISRPNEDMEHDGLVRVGIQIVNGPFIAEVVNPQTFSLRKNVLFLNRDSGGFTELAPEDRPFEE